MTEGTKLPQKQDMPKQEVLEIEKELHVLCIECPTVGRGVKPTWVLPEDLQQHMYNYHGKIVDGEAQINSWKMMGVYYEEWF